MLAIADSFGNVFAAIPGLASVANVSIESTEKAVANLLAPDPYSRTKDFGGRRIEAIDGGWHILNYGKYRKMMDEEERREYKAKWAREKRRQSRTNVDKNGQEGTLSRLSGHIPSASSSDSFWEELKRNPLYKGVDVEREFEKAKQWCKRKRRNLTRRFFEGWLEKADRVLVQLPPLKSNYLPPTKELSDEEFEAQKKVALEECAKAKAAIKQ